MADETLRPRRSVLYMPAANERALAKAKEIAADAIIFGSPTYMGMASWQFKKIAGCSPARYGRGH